MAHPWRALRALPRIDIVWVELPAGVRGLTDGRTRIWLHKRLIQRERRAALAHELIHVQRGHLGRQPPDVEREVRHAAGRWLLPDLGQVLDELVFYGGDLEAAAEALWVDRVTVEARLDRAYLSAAELAELDARTADLHLHG